VLLADPRHKALLRQNNVGHVLIGVVVRRGERRGQARAPLEVVDEHRCAATAFAAGLQHVRDERADEREMLGVDAFVAGASRERASF
jgi:hypothetical protein